MVVNELVLLIVVASVSVYVNLDSASSRVMDLIVKEICNKYAPFVERNIFSYSTLSPI